MLLLLISPSGSFAQSPKPSASPESEVIDVYALFWPITAGQTVADGTFFFKQLKESFAGFFKSGNIGKSEHQLELSEKRLVEATKLLETQDFANAKKSLDMNLANRDEAVRLKKAAIDSNEDTRELTLKLIKSLENQQKSIAYIATLFPVEQQAPITEVANKITLQISEVK